MQVINSLNFLLMKLDDMPKSLGLKLENFYAILFNANKNKQLIENISFPSKNNCFHMNVMDKLRFNKWCRQNESDTLILRPLSINIASMINNNN